MLGLFRRVHGPVMLARFLRFVERRYGVTMKFPETRDGFSEECFALYEHIRKSLCDC